MARSPGSTHVVVAVCARARAIALIVIAHASVHIRTRSRRRVPPRARATIVEGVDGPDVVVAGADRPVDPARDRRVDRSRRAHFATIADAVVERRDRRRKGRSTGRSTDRPVTTRR